MTATNNTAKTTITPEGVGPTPTPTRREGLSDKPLALVMPTGTGYSLYGPYTDGEPTPFVLSSEYAKDCFAAAETRGWKASLRMGTELGADKFDGEEILASLPSSADALDARIAADRAVMRGMTAGR